ncbi:MAG TPA: TonB-dependent receptor [Gemmatimonadaceae bacterium]|nr:TonB-dependent receptor [Gemmatimonadaceae bacterium]
MLKILAGFASALLIACAAQAAAQSDSTTSTHRLDATVVVAHRIPLDLRGSTAAVSVITRADLDRTQARTLPDALRYLPGLFFTSRDGGGALPVAMARGFFGGGENEYVLLLVDGVPVNTTRTTLVEWTSIPVAVIERIEVFRGSGSVLYGDAAIGGVINVITRAPTTNGSRAELGVAEREAREATIQLTRKLGDTWGTVGTVSHAEGPGNREHTFSRRISTSTAIERTLPAQRTRLALEYNRLADEDPGPLDETAATTDPRRANELFHADERTRDAAELVGILDRPLGPSQMLRVAARVHGARQGRTRTLLLTPSFGDTQFHHETDQGFWVRAQADQLGSASKFVTGVEVGRAGYESSYRSPATGDELSNSSGSRLALALYAEGHRELAARLRASAGARYDRITPSATLEDRDEEAKFSAVSGRVGINYGYRDGGNLYLVGSTSFKTPTLDQLYDSRRTPVGDDVFITISNPSLEPQRAREIEAGVFQRVPMGRSSIEISLSAYRRELEDEIDFDLATFRYGNIKRSRHESLEVLTLGHLWRDIELRNALTLGRATFRSGPYQGNQLKSLPRFATQSALSVPVRRDVALTFAHRSTSRTYLDDENTTTIPGIHMFDVGLRVGGGSLETSIRIENLADERRAGFGFLLFDPGSMRNVPMLYPQGGRTIRFAIKVE